MKFLEKLIALCPPPITPRSQLSRDDWYEHSKILGTRLPEQLVQVGATYGSGIFESVQSPINGSFGFYLSTLGRRSVARLSELRVAKARKPKAFPADLYFEPGGLLPIGWISEADICLRTVGDNPDKWNISILRTGTNKAHHLHLSIIEFCEQVVDGTFQSELFTKHVPTTKGFRFKSAGERVVT